MCYDPLKFILSFSDLFAHTYNTSTHCITSNTLGKALAPHTCSCAQKVSRVSPICWFWWRHWCWCLLACLPACLALHPPQTSSEGHNALLWVSESVKFPVHCFDCLNCFNCITCFRCLNCSNCFKPGTAAQPLALPLFYFVVLVARLVFSVTGPEMFMFCVL